MVRQAMFFSNSSTRGTAVSSKTRSFLRSKIRNNRSPMARIIARGLRSRIGACAAPQFCIESDFRRAVGRVAISPQGVQAGGIFPVAMSHRAPGVDEVGDEGTLGAEFGLLTGDLIPGLVRLGGFRRKSLALRKVVV